MMKIKYKFKVGQKCVYYGQFCIIIKRHVWPTEKYKHEPAYKVRVGTDFTRSSNRFIANVAETELEKFKGSRLEKELIKQRIDKEKFAGGHPGMLGPPGIGMW